MTRGAIVGSALGTLALCVASSFAGAQAEGGGPALQLSDFAFSAPLHPTRQAPVHVALIPDAVYRGVVDSGLADLRVFNGAGAPVPHAIRPAFGRAAQAPAPVPVPFFPLMDSDLKADRGGALSLRVERDASGAVIDLQHVVSAPGPDAEGRAPAAYLIDLRGLDAPAAELRVSFVADLGDHVTPVEADGSDDLVSFHRALARHTLVSLRYGGHVIERHAIPLSGLRHRFLRLRAPKAGFPGELTAVQIVAQPPTPVVPSHRVVVPGRPRAEEPGVYDFDLEGPMPVDAVALALPETNSLVRATLATKATPHGAEQAVHEGTFYRVTHGGAELQSQAVPIRRRQARHWIVRVDRRGGGIGGASPSLVLTRTPDQLLFLARGEAPFQLAYGHHAAEASAFAPAELLRVLPDQALAALAQEDTRVGDQVSRAGPAARKPPAPPPPYKTYLLWAVLVAGVVSLAVAALRLARSQAPG